MSKFEPIGSPPTDDSEQTLPPFNGDDVLVAVNIATAVVVRCASWSNGALWDLQGEKSQADGRGWWSYCNSVGQDKLEGIYEPTHWAPMPELPDEWQ